MTPDLINALFEFFAAAAVTMSIVTVLKQKMVRGVSIAHVGFFVLWGFWNLFYYPHLEQTLSFIAGIAVAIANTTWISLLIYYNLKEKRNGT